MVRMTYAWRNCKLQARCFRQWQKCILFRSHYRQILHQMSTRVECVKRRVLLRRKIEQWYTNVREINASRRDKIKLIRRKNNKIVACYFFQWKDVFVSALVASKRQIRVQRQQQELEEKQSHNIEAKLTLDENRNICGVCDTRAVHVMEPPATTTDSSRIEQSLLNQHTG